MNSNINKDLFIFFLFLLGFLLSCSMMEKEWHEYSSDIVSDLVLDSSGNIFITGTTTGNVNGFKNKKEDEKEGNPTTDIFVAKYSNSGNQEWIMQDGTKEDDTANGIALDSSGNIYVIGSSFFKFDKSGKLVWRKDISGYDIAIDSGDSVYAIIDSDSIRSFAKYDISGNNEWTSAVGKDVGSIVLGEPGYVYLGGTRSAEFFVVKFDLNGNKIWTQTIDGVTGTHSARVTSDKTNAVYLGGYTNADIENKIELDVTNLYLIKYDSNGNYQWIVQHGNNDYCSGKNLTTDLSGNIYVTGTVRGDIDGIANSGAKLFVMVFNPSGTRTNTYLASYKTPTAIALDLSSNIYLAGGTTADMYYASIYSESDAYVGKYNLSAILQWEDTFTSEPSRFFDWTSKLR